MGVEGGVQMIEEDELQIELQASIQDIGVAPKPCMTDSMHSSEGIIGSGYSEDYHDDDYDDDESDEDNNDGDGDEDDDDDNVCESYVMVQKNDLPAPSEVLARCPPSCLSLYGRSAAIVS